MVSVFREDLFLSFLKDARDFKTEVALFQAVSRSIRGIAPASGGGIMLLDLEQAEWFTPAASLEDASAETLLTTSRFSAGTDPLALLFSRGESCTSDFSTETPAPFRNMDPQVRRVMKTRLDVPLRTAKGMIGTLWAVDPPGGTFDPQSALRMMVLAGITGSVMASLSADRPRTRDENRPSGHFNTARDQAVDHLSHAIKTPLAVSLASLKLLRRQLRLLPETAWKRIYDRTERNLKRLVNLEYDLEDILRAHPQADDPPQTDYRDEPL